MRLVVAVGGNQAHSYCMSQSDVSLMITCDQVQITPIQYLRLSVGNKSLAIPVTTVSCFRVQTSASNNTDF